VTASTGQFAPGILVDRIVLRDTSTLASRLRAGPEWVLAAVGVVAVAVGFAAGRRPMTGRRKDEHG
jgi:apolipoprotein N-acyltransferase